MNDGMAVVKKPCLGDCGCGKTILADFLAAHSWVFEFSPPWEHPNFASAFESNLPPDGSYGVVIRSKISGLERKEADLRGEASSLREKVLIYEFGRALHGMASAFRALPKECRRSGLLEIDSLLRTFDASLDLFAFKARSGGLAAFIYSPADASRQTSGGAFASDRLIVIEETRGAIDEYVQFLRQNFASAIEGLAHASGISESASSCLA